MRVFPSVYALVLVLIPFTAFAESPKLWGELREGSHAVGFESFHETDPARPYKRKHDYEGNLIPGDRSRPIQVHVWYPASKTADTRPMIFEEYLYLLATEERGGVAAEADRKQAIDRFLSLPWAAQADPNKLQELLKYPTAAKEKAPPAPGRFPLVLIAQSVTMSFPFGNSVLSEYLAGHGYVVASVPSLGAQSRRISFDTEGILAQMQDLQHVLRILSKRPEVDRDRLALIGFSFGGFSTALIAMENTDVDAVVSLDSVIGNRFGHSIIFQNPLYIPNRLTAPFLHLTSAQVTPDTSDAFFKEAKYSTVGTVMIQGARPIDFSTLGMISALVPKFGGAPPEGADPAFAVKVVCEFTLHFLNAHVKKQESARAYLNQKQDERVTVKFRKGLPAPPTEQEFITILRGKGMEKASALYHSIKKNDPDMNVFDPLALNAVAEQYLKEKNLPLALQVLQLNAEAHPDAWEVFDLLGTLHMEGGNKQLAIENFERSLDLNPENNHAKEKIQQLKSGQAAAVKEG